jgi:hypothetical protein
LTKAYWKGKKKVGSVGGEPPSVYALAQSKISTGLGEALDKAETAWNKINWKLLNVTQAVTLYPEGGLVAARKAKARAEEYLDEDDLKNAVAKLKSAKTKADAAGKHKLLSKQANTAAKAIATKLTAQVSLLDSIDLTDFDQAINDWERYLKSFNDRYEEAFGKVVAGLKVFAAKPNKDNWDKSNLLSRASEASTIVKQAISAKQEAYRPYGTNWTAITSLSTKMHNDYEAGLVKKEDVATYLEDMKEQLQDVPPF